MGKGKMAVLIDNRQKKYKVSQARIKQTAKVALDDLGCTDAELSILVVDDPHIADLNQTYLDRPGPANVIAFPLREGRFTEFSSSLLGDVVISVDTAAREGEIPGVSTAKRLDELLVHGILHLVGYDHENNEDEAREMQAKSDHIMTLIDSLRGR